MPLRLRPFRLDDEVAAVAGHRELARENFQLLLGWEEGDDWAVYIDSLDKYRRKLDLYGDRVPAALLAAEVDGTFVGRASVRFQLNEWLALRGGHIGYCVLPDHRRRGLATEILRQALIIARSEGVNRALVVCNEDNVASAATIERCGGVLENVVGASDGDVAVRRYWID